MGLLSRHQVYLLMVVPGRNRSSKYRRQMNSLHKAFLSLGLITTMVSLLKKKKSIYLFKTSANCHENTLKI